MNQLIISGKVSRISVKNTQFGQGISLEHYPDSPSDTYVEASFIFPNELWTKYEIHQYDRVVLKCHLITLGKTEDSSKTKQLRIVDEVLEVSSDD